MNGFFKIQKMMIAVAALSVLFGLFPLPLHACKEFLAEGKQWEYHGVGMYRIEGDSLHDSRTYKKLYLDGQGGSDLFGLLREEGLRVFMVPSGGQEERLMLDFGLCVGDSLRFGSLCYKTTDRSRVVLQGSLLRKQYFLCHEDSSEVIPTKLTWMIEGVGCDEDIFCLCRFNTSRSRLLRVFEGGECIFNEADNMDSVMLPVVGEFEGHTIKDRKSWVMDDGDRLVVEGDTLLGQCGYACLYNHDSRGESQLVALLREEDRRIMSVCPGSADEFMVYDFGLQPGDVVACRCEGDFFWIEDGIGGASGDADELQVMAVDIIEVGGKPLRRLHLVQRHYELVDGGLQAGSYQPDIYWVEGIGSSYGLMSPCANLRTGAVAHLLKEVVESDGHVSFTAADFLQNITPVKKVSRPVSGKDFYTPDGRRVVGIPSKGICIERTCGTVRKVILK